jgi:hypothetical protein
MSNNIFRHGRRRTEEAAARWLRCTSRVIRGHHPHQRRRHHRRSRRFEWWWWYVIITTIDNRPNMCSGSSWITISRTCASSTRSCTTSQYTYMKDIAHATRSRTSTSIYLSTSKHRRRCLRRAACSAPTVFRSFHSIPIWRIDPAGRNVLIRNITINHKL